MSDPLLSAAVDKARWRLLPFLGLLYVVSYLDRINVSFAALTMNADLGLSQAAYGLGAGIFFVGYVLFEVPSNLILARVGARVWLARIMVSWGLATVALAAASGPTSFIACALSWAWPRPGFSRASSTISRAGSPWPTGPGPWPFS